MSSCVAEELGSETNDLEMTYSFLRDNLKMQVSALKQVSNGYYYAVDVVDFYWYLNGYSVDETLENLSEIEENGEKKLRPCSKYFLLKRTSEFKINMTIADIKE